MKFTDKKYSHLKDVDGNKIYLLNFYVYQLGFDDSYDDIKLDITINSDNSMDLDFDADTTSMFNNNLCFVNANDRHNMLVLFKNALLNYPYPNDFYELIFV